MDKMVTENEYSSWLFCTLQSEIEVVVGSVRKSTIKTGMHRGACLQGGEIRGYAQ